MTRRPNTRTRPALRRALFGAAAITAAALPWAAAATAQPGAERALTLWSETGFAGQSVTLRGPEARLGSVQFNDRARSATVTGRWELCGDARFDGRCELVSRDIADLSAVGLSRAVSSARPAARGRPGTGPGPGPRPRPGPGGGAAGDIVLFDRSDFRGTPLPLNRDAPRLSQLSFNDRARSVRVRNGVWRLCADANGGGRCEYVDRDVSDLRSIGLSGNLSSVERSPNPRAPNRYAIALFAQPNGGGSFVGFDGAIPDLSQFRFNDAASSVRVRQGRWLLCSDADYRGVCEVVTRPGGNLIEIGLDDRVSSLKPWRGPAPGRPGPGGGGFGPGPGVGPGGGYGPGPRPGPGPGPGLGGGFDTGRAGGVEGRQTVFFPRPRDAFGDAIRNREGAATRFCREAGLGRALFKADTRRLSDVLCAK